MAMMTYPFGTCVQTFLRQTKSIRARLINFSAVSFEFFVFVFTYNEANGANNSAYRWVEFARVRIEFEFLEMLFALFRLRVRAMRANRIGLSNLGHVQFDSILFTFFFHRSFFSPVNNCRFAHIRIDNHTKKNGYYRNEQKKNQRDT